MIIIIIRKIIIVLSPVALSNRDIRLSPIPCHSSGIVVYSSSTLSLSISLSCSLSICFCCYHFNVFNSEGIVATLHPSQRMGIVMIIVIISWGNLLPGTMTNRSDNNRKFHRVFKTLNRAAKVKFLARPETALSGAEALAHLTQTRHNIIIITIIIIIINK